VTGSMTIILTGTAGGGTDIGLRYRVAGYASDGIKKWAGPVDEVLGEQIARLKKLIDTGSGRITFSVAKIANSRVAAFAIPQST